MGAPVVAKMRNELRRYWMDCHQVHLIPALGAILILVVTGAFAAHILSSRNATLAHAEGQLDSTARVLAAQAHQLFRAVQLVQINIEDRLRTAGVIDKRAFEAEGKSQDLHKMLNEKIKTIAMVGDFALTSLEGQVLNSSKVWPVPEINASDRDYVEAFRLEPQLRTFVSKPVRSRMNGSWTTFLARRLSGTSGQDIGLVVAALRMLDFETFYQQLALPGGSAINLFRDDGVMLANYPRDEGASVRFTAEQPEFGAFASVHGGVFRQTSRLDGVERILAVQPVDAFPLVVTVSLPTGTALAVWRRDAILMAAVMLLADAIIVGAIYLAARQAGRTSRQARLDYVTGFYNRLRFREILDAALRTFLRTHQPFALLLLNLDQFKEVNEAFGHSTGDAVLRAAAKRIHHVLDLPDAIFRIGGDEFAVVLPGVAVADAMVFAERLVEGFKQPLEIPDQNVLLGVTIGITTPPASGQDAKSMFRDADHALRHAKTESRGRYEVFDVNLEDAVRARKEMERDLRRALELDQLSLAFQPLLSMKTGSVVAYEALLRWKHPRHGNISPVYFIPIAEETGLIVTIGRWVLDTACAEAVQWADKKVAVNLSPIQFRSGTVVEDIEAALARSGLAPANLEIEITESVQIVENQAVGDALRRVKDLGVGISLDDFGTGYSSLSYLSSFPFDKIKIDRSFVANMHSSPSAAAVVKATLQLARDLAMDTTAEGIETAEQFESLRQQGCTQAQGYFIGKPMSAAEAACFVLPSSITAA